MVLHDAAIGLAAGLECPVVWRVHEDASDAEGDALARIAELAGGAARCSCRTSRSRPPGIETTEAPPGIDPLDSAQPRARGAAAGPRGAPARAWTSTGPFCLQVLELDRWDDPHAAIDAFRLAQEEEPDLQLVLAALLDRADSEGWQAAKEVSDYAQGTDGVLLLTTYEGLGSLELGALLLLARVVIERSLREGFELAPFEALWKRTPVVGGLAARDPRRRGRLPGARAEARPPPASSSWCATRASPWRWAAPAASGCASTSS